MGTNVALTATIQGLWPCEAAVKELVSGWN